MCRLPAQAGFGAGDLLTWEIRMQLGHAVARHAGNNIALSRTLNNLPALRTFRCRLGSINPGAIILQLIRLTVQQSGSRPLTTYIFVEEITRISPSNPSLIDAEIASDNSSMSARPSGSKSFSA